MAQDTNNQGLIPRFRKQGYSEQDIERRRNWIEEATCCNFPLIAQSRIPGEEMRGNIENPIGSVQMPVGVAGPLLINGQNAEGTFYVPLATTEGALVRSYERGMVALTRSGGVSTCTLVDENRISPIFLLKDVAHVEHFEKYIQNSFETIKAEAESTTSHGKLLRLECHTIGRKVIVNFSYSTGDAQGMNMIMKATDQACRWIVKHTETKNYYIFSGFNSEKRASGSILEGGKGKKVVAGALLSAETVRTYLKTTPDEMVKMWQHTVIGEMQANSVGYNGHYANGLASIFIACGQDVANVANAAAGITCYEVTEDKGLYASVTLPSLTIATVGGGTRLGTSKECLDMLGCAGSGKARKFGEIIAATILAGELSFGAAIATGQVVAAHESYGRNRPTDKK